LRLTPILGLAQMYYQMGDYWKATFAMGAVGVGIYLEVKFYNALIDLLKAIFTGGDFDF
jgi:hypothetical protein